MALLLKDIQKELKKFGRDPEDYPLLKIKKLEVTESVGVKAITYKALVEGELYPDNIREKYTAFVQFLNVDFSKEPKDGYIKAVVAKDRGKPYYYSKPDFKKNPIVLKCACYDFRFTWEKQLYDRGSLIGTYRRYKRVKGSNRPPRNPLNLVGYCKHISSLIYHLENKGYVDF